MPVSCHIERMLFEAAQDLTESADRTAFLDHVCKGQPELRVQLEELLAVQSPADEFFSKVPLFEAGAEVVSPTPPTEKLLDAVEPKVPETASAIIGRYRLLERLGEGGCGVVYLADQLEPVRRKVALKIIRLGMDTESVIARFEAERQALALMDHPNIAQVFDAGATESGRPYFVMEWVQGSRINDYCNEHHLEINERLKLFIQVCQAIQHAHQKGIIHRDIKPSNVLVSLKDGVAVPKVIDFGIAKATEGRLADNTVFTACDQFIGTPAYMSPEQADMSGLDVDTRSDIYSLGVLLYELLSGQTPFDSKELVKGGVDELRRTLREREPQPPSTMLTTLGDTRLTAVAAQYHADPARLISTLRGDLDWIVMKALEKDRNRRYETANGLAFDVQRYLNNEPVVARPPSRLYQFQKLVRRNQVVFMAITAVAASLLIGLGVSTRLFIGERKERRRAVAAEQQQIHLREEADRLRLAAEYRQRLTEATVARSRSLIDKADNLVAGIPAPEPNLEYADLYRTLGDWHAVNSRWKPAADRFAVLVQVNQPDDWDSTTLDYLRYGPALVECGDVDGYEQFREMAVQHFAESSNPVSAERVVKVSLLTPASRVFLASLRPLALTASNSMTNTSALSGAKASMSAWRAFSLALLEYRRGNYAGVDQWYQKSIKIDPAINNVRGVTFQIVLAMAHYKAGKTWQARLELAKVRQQVENRFQNEAAFNGGELWFDWDFARILLREATGLMDQTKH